jgi:hypothetical protein
VIASRQEAVAQLTTGSALVKEALLYLESESASQKVALLPSHALANAAALSAESTLGLTAGTLGGDPAPQDGTPKT